MVFVNPHRKKYKTTVCKFINARTISIINIIIALNMVIYVDFMAFEYFAKSLKLVLGRVISIPKVEKRKPAKMPDILVIKSILVKFICVFVKYIIVKNKTDTKNGNITNLYIHIFLKFNFSHLTFLYSILL